ncbi:MAG: hypothetical protein HY726_08530 [Candidatus Rokubacteria bacterium]|nr:hypothetical protein [Candidatus Rokubacteria bacterium]
MVTAGAATARLVPLLGVGGLVTWLIASNFKPDVPPLAITRIQAQTIAEQALAERGIQLRPPWTIYVEVQGQPEKADRFVWQKGGTAAYLKLMGTYLRPPHFRIRFAVGQATPEFEVYDIFVDGTGNVFRFNHSWAATRPPKGLVKKVSRDEARTIAHSVLWSNYNLDPTALPEVSVFELERPAYYDWKFVFEDAQSYPIKEGQARIAISIAGNEAVDTERYVQVPVRWFTGEIERSRSILGYQLICGALTAMLVLIATVGAILRWVRVRGFPTRLFLGFLSGISVLNVVSFAAPPLGGFPVRSSESLNLGFYFGATTILALLTSSVMALFAALIHAWDIRPIPLGRGKALLWGLSLGALGAGFVEIVRMVSSPLRRLWPDYGPAGLFFPLVGTIFLSMAWYVFQVLFIMTVLMSANRLTENWTRRIAVGIALFILLGFTITGTDETLQDWLVAGSMLGILISVVCIYVLQYYVALVPLALGTMSVLNMLKQGFYQAYPEALPGAIIGAVLVSSLAYYWFQALARYGSKPTS